MSCQPGDGQPRQDMTPSLVAKLRAGDADAGGWLERLYRQPLVRFCFGHLRSMQEAEDAAQDIFCKVLASHTVPDNFRAWLYRIARNHCLNLLRDRERNPACAGLPSGSHLAGSRTGHLSRLVRHEVHARLDHLIAALPPEISEPLRLRYGEGLSRSEIAYVLDLPESVVKSRLFEGLKKLRQHISLL